MVEHGIREDGVELGRRCSREQVTTGVQWDADMAVQNMCSLCPYSFIASTANPARRSQMTFGPSDALSSRQRFDKTAMAIVILWQETSFSLGKINLWLSSWGIFNSRSCQQNMTSARAGNTINARFLRAIEWERKTESETAKQSLIITTCREKSFPAPAEQGLVGPHRLRPTPAFSRSFSLVALLVGVGRSSSSVLGLWAVASPSVLGLRTSLLVVAGLDVVLAEHLVALERAGQLSGALLVEDDGGVDEKTDERKPVLIR